MLGVYVCVHLGKNAPGDLTSMVEAVFPLLQKYHVDMYLCGHDHLLQVLLYYPSLFLHICLNSLIFVLMFTFQLS